MTARPVRAQNEATKASPAATSSPAPTAKEDLIAVAKSAGNFTTFLKVVEAAGLTATLQQAGTYTVFAPTDTAFSKLPAGKLDELLKPENKAKLVALVSYHVASTKLTAADLAKTDEVKTLEGTEIDVDATHGRQDHRSGRRQDPGQRRGSDQRRLHAIDAVLQP